MTLAGGKTLNHNTTAFSEIKSHLICQHLIGEAEEKIRCVFDDN